MKLLIDIGNSRIKWAVQDGDQWRSGAALARQNKAFKDLARPAWKDLDVPQRVIVSCVAGSDYAKSVRTWVKRRWKLEPEFLQAQVSQCGVINAYRDPARLGADRWAALLAARELSNQPVVVVDCGTAVTVDAMNADGRHLGGLIAPGIELMTASLVGNAPGIDIIDTNNNDIPLLGGSTEAGVSGGVLYAVVAFIDRVFADVRAELGRTTRLLLTGGDAERIHPLLSGRPLSEPELVLKGLAVFAAECPQAVGGDAVPDDDTGEPGEAVDVEAVACDS